MDRSLQEFLRQAAAELYEHSPSPRLDAEVLAMHVCTLDRAQLITRADVVLTPKQEQALQALLAQRQAGMPMAYITGVREFWSMAVGVTPDTLIPRPDTETLVEHALALIPAQARWHIADLGTGSGAIALALARERPHCRIIATDTSNAALAVARANATRHRLDNIEFRAGSWQAPLGHEVFEMIVSNPPYIRLSDVHLSHGDVRFEPYVALIAGEDGLDAIRHIALHSPPRLKTGGWLLLEHGFDQAEAVANILRANDYQKIATFQDYAGQARVTQATVVRE